MKISKIVFYFTVSLLFISKNIFSASIDGTTEVKYLTTNQVFHNNEYARGYVTLNSGATILSDATAFLNITTPLKGGLDLRDTGTLSLEGDLYLDSNVTLSRSGVIRGNGKTIFLNGNLTIPDNSIIHINSNTVIDGQGKDLIFGRRGRIFVDTNITLTLRNMKIVQSYNDFSDSCIRLAAFESHLALDNVELALSQDFLFSQGQFFIHGDVVVTGTSAFIYQSTQHSFIASNSTFYFDKATTFSVMPATITDCKFDQWPTYTSNRFIVMADQTSRLLFNEASLCSTPTGCRFTKGVVNFKNQCFVKSNSAFDLSSTYIEATNQIASTGNLPFCSAYSPDGNYLAVVSKQSNSLQIFNSTSLIQIGSDVITGSYPVSVSWSNSSTQLAVVNSGDNTVKVFNFNGVATPTFFSGASTDTKPSCVAWSPYGRYIAVTSAGSNTLQIFRSSTLFPVGSGGGTDNIPSSVDWSIGDRFLAVTNSGSNTLQIFSFSGSSTPIQVATTTTGFIPSSVAWARNGIFLSVVNSGSNSAQIFSFDCYGNLDLIDTMLTDYTPISTGWTLDGKYLAFVNYTSDSLQFLTFFNQSTLNQIGATVSPPGRPYDASWSPDDRFIAIVDQSSSTLQVYSFDGYGTPTLVAEVNTAYGPRSVAWSTVDNFIAVINESADSLQVFSFDEFGSPVLVLSSAHVPTRGISPNSVSWSPDGRFISVSNYDSNSLAVFSFDKTRTSTVDFLDKVDTNVKPRAEYWSPDGNFIAVVTEISYPVDGTLQVFSFDEASTTTISLVDSSTYISSCPLSLAWSPDSNFIAVGSSGALNIFSFDGISAPTQVAEDTEVGGSIFVSWSRDGRFIAAASGSSVNTLRLYSFNGIGSVLLSSLSAITSSSPSSVSWSHNGQFITIPSFSFTIGNPSLQVFKMSDARSKTQLSGGVSTKQGPTSVSWSPDNTCCSVASGLENKLQIFQVYQPAPVAQIGSDILTNSPNWVALSPDGRFIAVVSKSGNTLKVLKFDGIGSSVEIGSISCSNVNSVSWSPDGRLIAVSSGGSAVMAPGTLEVYSFDGVGGFFNTAYLNTSTMAYSPVWSPDGKFIAFTCAGGTHSLEIYRYVGVYSSAPHPIPWGFEFVNSISTSGYFYAYPFSVSWSADGRFISVVNAGDNNLKVFSFTESDGSLTQVASTATATGPYSNLWSPDGKFVAVVNSSSNVLQVFAFDGVSTLRQVGSNAKTGDNPRSLSWSSDGKFVVVVNYYSGTLQIYAFDGASSPVQVGEDILTGDGSCGVAWMSDGKFIAVVNSLANTLQSFAPSYVPDRSTQAISNGVVFGNSKLGSDYDVLVNLLAGANVNVDGLVNYDCVN